MSDESREKNEQFARQLMAVDQAMLEKMLEQVMSIYKDHMENFEEFGWSSEDDARREAIVMTLDSVYSWIDQHFSPTGR